MYWGGREGQHSRCRMSFGTVVICAVVLAAAWIPSSSGGVPARSAGSGDVQTVLVVSNDGRPDHFASVQAAVDAVPMWNYLRWVIYIKPGVYYGPVIVPEGKVLWPQSTISSYHNLLQFHGSHQQGFSRPWHITLNSFCYVLKKDNVLSGLLFGLFYVTSCNITFLGNAENICQGGDIKGGLGVHRRVFSSYL
jgi:hypothetical protein